MTYGVKLCHFNGGTEIQTACNRTASDIRLETSNSARQLNYFPNFFLQNSLKGVFSYKANWLFFYLTVCMDKYI